MKAEPPEDDSCTATTVRAGTSNSAAAPGADELGLARFDATAEARHLEQLVWDRRLLDRVMWSGYTGPAWEIFATRLVAYSLRVMAAWITSGEVIARCAAKGWASGLVPDARLRRQDVAEELAQLVVGEAIVSFRNTVLIPGKWDHTRGATLKTYFIGHVLLRYRNAYRTWNRQERRQWPLTNGDMVPERESEAFPAPGRDLLTREALAELSRQTDPVTLEVAALRSENYTWDEVAEITGLTVANAKSRLYRLQLKMNQQETA